MFNRHEALADDEQAAFGNEVMHVGDAAEEGVFHWDHGVARMAFTHRRERVLEAGAGERLERGKRFAGGDVGVRPRFALKRNTIGHGAGALAQAPPIR